MKTPLSFGKGLLEKAVVNVWQLLSQLLCTPKKILFSVILFNVFSPSISQGQTVIRDKTFGGSVHDFLTSAISTPDGGYLLVGDSRSTASGDKSEIGYGLSDYWIVKVDAQLNKQWDKTFGGDFYDEGVHVILAPDGGYLLLGLSGSDVSGNKTSSNKGSADFWLIKIDQQGNKVWEKDYGGSGNDAPFKIISLKGGYLLAGISDSNASGDKSEDRKSDLDYWILRINPQGHKIWDKTIASSTISVDKIEKSAGSSDNWNVRINKQGNKVSDKTFRGTDLGALFYTVSNADGSYILAGSVADSEGGFDILVEKFNAAGIKEWDKTFGGDSDDFFSCAASTPDGGYVLASSSSSNASGDKSENSRDSSADYWVIKIDAQGNKKWDKTIGGNQFDWPNSIIFSNGVYLVAGYSNSNISGDKTENRRGTNPDNRGDFDYWSVLLTDPDQASRLAGCHLVDVYPSHASSIINIRHEGKADQANLSILDFNGKLIMERPISKEPLEQLDVSSFRKGIHYLKVISPEGSQIIRVVIE